MEFLSLNKSKARSPQGMVDYKPIDTSIEANHHLGEKQKKE